MPIHDLGYRKWDGKQGVFWLRWVVIAQGGIRLAWKSQWLKRLMLVAWTPAILFGFAFFSYEQFSLLRETNPEVKSWIWRARISMAEDPEEIVEILKEAEENQALDSIQLGFDAQEQWKKIQQRNEVFEDWEEERRLGHRPGPRRGPPPRPDESNGLSALAPRDLVKDALRDPDVARNDVWAYLLMRFFQYPQGLLMVMVVGLIAPQLISNDVRSRAFLSYFSRPINRVDYMVGKSAVVWCYLALITTAPALVLYFIGVSLSPNWSVVFDTWDLPLRILLASILLLIPATSLALMFSSLTSETRYAQYAWYAVWAMGMVAYLVLLNTGQTWSQVSLFHILWIVQGWVFGLEDWDAAFMPLMILLAMTVGSLIILTRRVSAPMRI